MKEQKTAIGIYIPQKILTVIDEQRGRISRSSFLVMIIEDAVKRGIDIEKLVAGEC